MGDDAHDDSTQPATLPTGAEPHASDAGTGGWESAEAAFSPWFESRRKFKNLPKEARALFRRGEMKTSRVAASTWNQSSPDQRRQIARQRDYQTHPGLETAHDAGTGGYQSAEVTLAPVFESRRKFKNLPKEFQVLFRRGEPQTLEVAAVLWNQSTPDQRRELARQRDYQTHPRLEAAHKVMWDKMAAVDRWERVASNKPEADRDARDVTAQDEALDRARKELANAEAVLNKLAKNLDLGLPDGEDLAQPVPNLTEDGAVQRPTSGKTRRGRYDFRSATLKVSTELHASGIPERGDGGQARLEELVRLEFPAEKCPATSTIRKMVSEVIEAHRQAIAKAD